jgi:hypothetical protein
MAAAAAGAELARRARRDGFDPELGCPDFNFALARRLPQLKMLIPALDFWCEGGDQDEASYRASERELREAGVKWGRRAVTPFRRSTGRRPSQRVAAWRRQ